MKIKRIKKSKIKDKFIKLPVDPIHEIVIKELDYELDEKLIKGSRIKPIVYIKEEKLDQFDSNLLKKRIFKLGAIYCKNPIINVIRKKIRRDSRHDFILQLEDSIKLFAKETRPKNKDKKIEFTIQLAKEADEL